MYELDWLARVQEDALDVEQEIVDPHHHLWDRADRRYLVDELHEDIANGDRPGHRVVQTVFVECMASYRTDGPERLRPVGETEFVAAQARASRGGAGPEIAGIVSFADLTLGDAVEDVLAAHERAGAGLFRGIRHAAGWDAAEVPGNSHTHPTEHLLSEPSFRDGFRRLGASGWRFDAWLYHPQLPQLLDLVRACPETPVILDHIGAPMGVGPYAGRRDEVVARWRPAMEALAACPSVTLKVGGIGMNRYYGGGWPDRADPPTSEELASYWGDELVFCIDTFGPDRCMFESNFPVDRESCSYTVLWNTFKRIARRYGAAERQDLFCDTARRVYGLATPPT